MSPSDENPYRGRRRPGRPRPQRRPDRARDPDAARESDRVLDPGGADALWLHGLHSVAAALANPRRVVRRLLVTRNALARLQETGAVVPAVVEEVLPKELDRLLGAEAVHQGIAAEVAPLPPASLDSIAEGRLIVVLDQITDPHNVGAILRSAAAMGAVAVVTTGRHAPAETAVLAKAASGALEHVPLIEVTNLARALDEVGRAGFFRVGLDSDGTTPIEQTTGAERTALVLGAEGRGLRRLTREHCDVVARLDMPGPIRSLNVSNAAALALYVFTRGTGAKAG